jgi:hypothetical protein
LADCLQVAGTCGVHPQMPLAAQLLQRLIQRHTQAFRVDLINPCGGGFGPFAHGKLTFFG